MPQTDRFAAASPWPAAGRIGVGGRRNRPTRQRCRGRPPRCPDTAGRASAYHGPVRFPAVRTGSVEAAASAAGLPAGIAAPGAGAPARGRHPHLHRPQDMGRPCPIFMAFDALAVWMPCCLPAEIRPLPGGRRSARPLQDYTEPSHAVMQLLAELGKRGLAPSGTGGIQSRTAAAPPPGCRSGRKPCAVIKPGSPAARRSRRFSSAGRAVHLACSMNPMAGRPGAGRRCPHGWRWMPAAASGNCSRS